MSYVRITRTSVIRAKGRSIFCTMYWFSGINAIKDTDPTMNNQIAHNEESQLIATSQNHNEVLDEIALEFIVTLSHSSLKMNKLKGYHDINLCQTH